MINKILKFVRFSIVGGICAIIDYTIFFIGYALFGLHYLHVLGISLLFSGSTNYILNKYFTFKDKSTIHVKQVSKFALVVFLSIILNFALMYLFVDIILISPLIARIFTILLAWFFNFTMHNFFTFRK